MRRLRIPRPTWAHAVLVASLLLVVAVVIAYVRLSLDEAALADLQRQFIVPGISRAQGDASRNFSVLAVQQRQIEQLRRDLDALRAQTAPTPVASGSSTPAATRSTPRPSGTPARTPVVAPTAAPRPQPSPSPAPRPSPSPSPCLIPRVFC